MEKIHESNVEKKNVNIRKAAVIGCGFVGSSTAFALMEGGIFNELVLIDVDHSRAEGEAMDISHGVPFAKPMKIYAGTYDDIHKYPQGREAIGQCTVNNIMCILRAK